VNVEIIDNPNVSIAKLVNGAWRRGGQEGDARTPHPAAQS
jgi:hypothetical protein